MPDLIIKPTATSGNKLILQDQAGGAVLTTADSGATASNVTLASTTTFPANHIIQVVSNSSQGNADSGSEFITYCTCGITVKKAGSKILVIGNPQIYTSTADALSFVRLKYKTGSLTRTATVGDYTDFATNERWMGDQGDANTWQQGLVLNLWTHGQSADTQIHIAISTVASAGHSYSNNGTNARSEMTLMEVMQ